MDDSSTSSSLVPLIGGGAAGAGSPGRRSSGASSSSGSGDDDEGGGRLAITDNANRSSSQLTAQMIMQKGKYGVAMFITNELAREKLQLTTTTTITSASSSSGTGTGAVNKMSSTTTTSATGVSTGSATTASSVNVDDAIVVGAVNQTGTGGVVVGVGGSNSSAASATASSVRSQKPIGLEHHLRSSGTVPKQQHSDDHHDHHHHGQYHPLDMTIGHGGTDVQMMDSGSAGALMLLDMDNSDPAFTGSHYLNLLLDDLLMPDKRINDPETIDWCKWLIAGGRIPEDFAQIGE